MNWAELARRLNAVSNLPKSLRESTEQRLIRHWAQENGVSATEARNGLRSYLESPGTVAPTPPQSMDRILEQIHDTTPRPTPGYDYELIREREVAQRQRYEDDRPDQTGRREQVAADEYASGNPELARALALDKGNIEGPILGREEESGRPPSYTGGAEVPSGSGYSTYASGFQDDPDRYGQRSLIATITEPDRTAETPEVVSGSGRGGGNRGPGIFEQAIDAISNRPTNEIVLDTSYLGDMFSTYTGYSSALTQLADRATADYMIDTQERRDRWFTEIGQEAQQLGFGDQAGALQTTVANVHDPYVEAALLSHGFNLQEIAAVNESTLGYMASFEERLPLLIAETEATIGRALAEQDEEFLRDALSIQQAQEMRDSIGGIYQKVADGWAGVEEAKVAIQEEADLDLEYQGMLQEYGVG